MLTRMEVVQLISRNLFTWWRPKLEKETLRRNSWRHFRSSTKITMWDSIPLSVLYYPCQYLIAIPFEFRGKYLLRTLSALQRIWVRTSLTKRYMRWSRKLTETVSQPMFTALSPFVLLSIFRALLTFTLCSLHFSLLFRCFYLLRCQYLLPICLCFAIHMQFQDISAAQSDSDFRML